VPAPVSMHDASTAIGEDTAHVHAFALGDDRFEVQRDEGAGDGGAEGDGAQGAVVVDGAPSARGAGAARGAGDVGGQAVRAAIVVGGSDDSSATRLKLDFLTDVSGAPLYKLEFVDSHRCRHEDRLDGMGEFHDLRQLSLFEVAR
jgi:hypothetical protein